MHEPIFSAARYSEMVGLYVETLAETPHVLEFTVSLWPFRIRDPLI